MDLDERELKLADRDMLYDNFHTDNKIEMLKEDLKDNLISDYEIHKTTCENHKNESIKDIKTEVGNPEEFICKLSDTKVRVKDEYYIDEMKVHETFDNIWVKQESTNLNPEIFIRNNNSTGGVVLKSFADSNRGLECDEKIHKAENMFQCKSCSKSFMSCLSLANHMRVHNDSKRVACSVCSKTFSSNSYLVRHSRIHTEENHPKSERKFRCELCFRSFVDYNSFDIHQKLHRGEKPYTCEACLKSFFRSSDLVNHSRIHTGEKPFQCKICSKSFSRSDGLTYHYKIHINDKQ